MKTKIKTIIGNIMKKVITNPTGMSCLNLVGYYCTTDAKYKSSHKLIDPSEVPEFSELAKYVIDNQTTLLHYDRLYTLYQAVKNVRNKKAVFAEVGTYKGGGSYFIASSMKGVDKWELHSFDTFEGHDAKDITEQDNLHKAKSFNDTSYEAVKKLLSPFPQVNVYKGRFEDSAHNIKNKTFGFVHLDMDIYAPTVHALEFFDSRIINGGVIVLDDYGFKTCAGVKKAVDDFLEVHKNYYFMHLTTGQCILIKGSD